MYGIRLGFLVAPEALIAALVELKVCTVGPAALFVQQAMTDFIESGEYQRHLNRVLKIYRERRARLLESLDARLAGAARWSGSQGGVHVYLRLPSALDATEFAVRAVAMGVAATPFPAAPGELRLALGYGGIDAEDVDGGVAALAAAVR